MKNSDELFLYFAQIGDHRSGKDDGSRRPDNWVPQFDKAYEKFVLSNQNAPQDLRLMSDELFSIFRQMIKFDYLHQYLLKYFELERSFRRLGRSNLSYDISSLESELNKVTPLFRAQYSNEEKLKLRPEMIPEDLLTATGGRIVRLKDYLFYSGPSSLIPSASLYNHKGVKIDWP